MGIHFNFVAPNIGFQKNIPYQDNTELRKKIAELFTIAQKFGISLGFHSGSGKSAENYRSIGEITSGCFEIKTSGRYTYEMGVALSRSTDPIDKQLWADWYNFTKKLAVEGVFSANATQQSFAREFIASSLTVDGIAIDNTVFSSRESLQNILNRMTPSTEHAFWFEYNFYLFLRHKATFIGWAIIPGRVIGSEAGFTGFLIWRSYFLLSALQDTLSFLRNLQDLLIQ